MTARYTAGCVWRATVDFGDGPREKYFVLLTDCLQPEEKAIVAIATSRGVERYGSAVASGKACCQPSPCFRIDPGQEACFARTTWVQFDNGPHVGPSVNRVGLDEEEKAGKAKFVQMLGGDRIRSLLRCAAASKDIPKRDKMRIDAKLKALIAELKAGSTATPPSTGASLSDPIEALRVRFTTRCNACRASFSELLVNAADVFGGGTSAPHDFVSEAEAAFSLLDGCPTCSPQV